MVSALQPVQNAELFDGLVVVPNIIGGGKIRQIPDSISVKQWIEISSQVYVLVKLELLQTSLRK